MSEVGYLVETELDHRPIAGQDSMILVAPPGLFTNVGGFKAPNIPLVSLFVDAVSRDAALKMGEDLHHAEWVATTDPDLVQRIGMIHDCPTCSASTDQALALLRDMPEQHLLAGVLFWAG
ncbi:MAG: hypothetical protein ABWY93_18755 [Mycobacterium sp.]